MNNALNDGRGDLILEGDSNALAKLLRQHTEDTRAIARQ
jgi:hypothetical protein